MIVEANSLVMTGRQFTAVGATLAGAAPPASGTVAMPIKKRKVECRASMEMSRASLDCCARSAAPFFPGRSNRGSIDTRRPSVDVRRPSIDVRGSVDTRRPSIEVRVSYDLGHGTLDVTRRSYDPAGQTANVVEIGEDTDMDVISENNSAEEKALAENQAEDEVTATYRPGGFMTKLFGLQRPSCVKVKKDDNVGFIVNKRFMDLVDKRNKSQKSEMERLRRENEALKNANKSISSNYMNLMQQQQQQPQQPSQPAFAAQPTFLQPATPVAVQHQFMFAGPTAYQPSATPVPWQSMSYQM